MDGVKHQRVKNKWYREFLDIGRITTVTKDELDKALENIQGNNRMMGRALLITLYYTGCRPAEALLIKTSDCRIDGTNLVLFIRTAKRGVPREIYLPTSNPHIKELKKYVLGMPPGAVLFYQFVSRARHKKMRKSGEVYYIAQTTRKIESNFKKWFSGVRDGGIIPYFLRHNAFSRMVELGYKEEDIKYLKGAKSMNSVQPYIHISSVRAKKLSRGIGKI